MTSKLTSERIEWLNYAATGLAANGTEMAMSPQDVIALTECCLAAMDSEPVAYMYRDNLHSDARFSLESKIGNWSPEDINEYEISETPLYRHAQPAPVLLDGLIKAVEFYEQVKRENPPVETGAWKDAVDWVLKEACRAAMLQAGNSPVIPEGWQVEAERLAEMHGMSFVLFRHGEAPQCADPTKVVISFTDKGLGHDTLPAAPQELK